MKLKEELLPGVYLVQLRKLEDSRGTFVKTYSNSIFRELGIDLHAKEEYYSVSARNVIRGMHFQTPPHEHVKVVYCAVGAVNDVVLDLRPGPGYGRHASTLLEAQTPSLLVIPAGVAHGFHSLQDGSLMVYKTTTEHAPSNDAGLHWDSFGFDWQLDGSPIVSSRDQTHPNFVAYTTPF